MNKVCKRCLCPCHCEEEVCPTCPNDVCGVCICEDEKKEA